MRSIVTWPSAGEDVRRCAVVSRKCWRPTPRFQRECRGATLSGFLAAALCCSCAEYSDPLERRLAQRSGSVASTPSEATPAANPGAGASTDGEPTLGETFAASSGSTQGHLANEARAELLATAPRTMIYAHPDVASPRLGYLRAGQRVARSGDLIEGKGCRRFQAIEPRGYVCVGVDASVEADHPARYVNLEQPNVDDVLPYVYGLSRYPTPPLYTRVPTAAEQSRTEPLIERYLPRRDMTPWLKLGMQEIPDFLREHASSYHVSGIRRGRRPLTDGQAFVDSGFAFIRRFASSGRYFGLTTDLHVLPLDRLNLVSPSVFRGVELDEGLALPVAFVRDSNTRLYSGQPDLGLESARAVGFREMLRLSGVQFTRGQKLYWQTQEGEWLEHTEHVTVIEPRKTFPDWAESGRLWIDVSLLRQTLVAYQGRVAKYATLISSGRDGIRDPASSHATLQGQFVIHTKHLTAPMTGSGEGAFHLREVPYVQYFSGGYALHAAYWHDDFGRPKSHGCINLSPSDAKWLFQWTTPTLPRSWHGVLATDGGTWVTIHR